MESMRIKCPVTRKFLAEILGTFVFLSIGIGSVAQGILCNNNSNFTINAAFSFGISLGIIIAGNISGGHLNPAVSFAFLLNRQLKLKLFFIYIAAQAIGAFVSCLVVYLIYYEALKNFDGGQRITVGHNSTANVWVTFPAEHVTTVTKVSEELFSTFLFVLFIITVTDERNGERANEVNGVLIGLSCFLVLSSFESNAGGALNPARDFVPRLFAFMIGYGSVVFSLDNYFFWIPLFVPLIGSALAVFVHALLIKNHWPDEEIQNNETVITNI